MPDLEWYYGPGYFIDDVKGGALHKQSCIDARKLEMQFSGRWEFIARCTGAIYHQEPRP